MFGAVSVLAFLLLGLLVAIAIHVGLFYLACLLTSSPLPNFFKSLGLVAMAIAINGTIFGIIGSMITFILVAFYDVSPQALAALHGSGAGALFVRLMIAVFGFCLCVVVAGVIYNWGLKIENGQSIATVQYGIPMAFSMLIVVVGLIGRITGVIVDPPEPEPTPIARITPAPVPTPPRPVPQERHTIVVEPTPQPEPPQPAFIIPQATTPTPVPPRVEYPSADTTPQPPYGVPGQPYQSSMQPSAESQPAPDTASRQNPFSQQPPGAMAAESLPFEIPFGGQAVPATRPIPEGLLSRADWAMEYGQLQAGQQHLYAAAVVDDDPLVWQNVAWSENFNRPLFCVMCGVGVQGAIPAGIDPNVATAGIASAVQTELQDIARRSVFSKHAEQLVADVGISADRNKLLANARDAGLDMLAVVNLQTSRNGDVMLYVYLFNVANGNSLWRSEGLTKTRYLKFREQGQDLGVELAAEAGQQASRYCGLSPSCPLNQADARAQMRAYVDTRPSNPLEGLFLLKYLHRQQKIGDLDQSLFLSDLVGKDAAAVLSGNDAAAKKQLVARWLPELRPPAMPRPAVNRPFGGFPGGNAQSSADESTPEGAATDAEGAPLPRRPVTPGAGGNRFFID